MAEKIKILIVDDEQNMLVTLDDIFDSLGYEVATAENGAIAIDMMKNHTFNVILMDFKMPEMNGVEASREIKKIDPDVKIIFITAYYDESIIKEAMDEGAVGVCHKPFSIPQLVEYINIATVS